MTLFFHANFGPNIQKNQEEKSFDIQNEISKI